MDIKQVSIRSVLLFPVLIADAYNNRIRRVSRDGIISTVAGNGTADFSGDGGEAVAASLNLPYGVAFATLGNLYIADYYNNRIRKVFLSGSPSLTLTNVSAAADGLYQVIITSPYGSVTSVVASLTVVPPVSPNGAIVINVPVITGTNLILGFTLTQTSSASFTLLQASNLSGPWTTNSLATLATNTSNGAYQFSLPTPDTVEFYQVRSP